MAFYKILSVLIIAISLFSSNVFSMNEDDLLDSKGSNYSSIPTPIKADIEEKECCSHWGLSHWFAGIGEYFQRCICCKPPSKEGKYKYNREIEDRRTGSTKGMIYKSESDCVYISFGELSDGNIFNNPIIGTLCCPIIAATHLCCLPCACCEASEKRDFSKDYKFDPIVVPYEPYNPHKYCTPSFCSSSEEFKCNPKQRKEEEKKKKDINKLIYDTTPRNNDTPETIEKKHKARHGIY